MSIDKPVFLGPIGPQALACLRSWGRRGLKAGMICVQGATAPPPRSRYLTDWVSVPREELHTPVARDKIGDFLSRFEAESLICVNERTAMWLQDERERFPPKTVLCLPRREEIANVLSKKAQASAARRAGFSTLPTYIIASKAFDTQSISQNHFPLCLRPTGDGPVRPRFKVLVVSDTQELQSLLNGISRLDGSIIAQPFKSLPNLVIHGARTRDGRVLALTSFLVDRKFQGVTLTIRHIKMPVGLSEKTAMFAQEMGLIGPFHLELLFDPDSQECHFLEVNNRLGGTTGKVLACGYDEPMLALAAFDCAEEPSMSLSTKSVTNRMALFSYIKAALTDKLTVLDYPQESNNARLRHATKAGVSFRDELVQFDDLPGSVGIYWQSFHSKLR